MRGGGGGGYLLWWGVLSERWGCCMRGGDIWCGGWGAE